jgi:hypothetical protein
VNETSETVATISAHDSNSDDNSSDISDVAVYFDEEVFKEEEGTNESIEKVSKKSEVIAKGRRHKRNP